MHNRIRKIKVQPTTKMIESIHAAEQDSGKLISDLEDGLLI